MVIAIVSASEVRVSGYNILMMKAVETNEFAVG
jgi:hypothetical protein